MSNIIFGMHSSFLQLTQKANNSCRMLLTADSVSPLLSLRTGQASSGVPTKLVYSTKGVLMEAGTHDELLAKAGFYAGLYKMQSGKKKVQSEPALSLHLIIYHHAIRQHFIFVVSNFAARWYKHQHSGFAGL